MVYHILIPMFELLRGKTMAAALTELQRLRSFSYKKVFKLKALLHSYFVVHCADHEPHRIYVYCPFAYVQNLIKTWTDESLFQ
jgi:hypothetical protein